MNATRRTTSHRQTMGNGCPSVLVLSTIARKSFTGFYGLFLRIVLRSGSSLWHVVTGTRSSPITFVGNIHADPAESPILLCVRGSVADLVLRSKFVMNIEEAAGQVLNLQWEKCLTACLFCELLEGLVAAFLFFRTKEGR